MTRYLALLLATCLPVAAQASPEVPGARQTRPIALVGGTIHPVSGPAIPNGTLVFDNGHIVAIGTKVKIQDDAQRIDISGKHVYPGLFESLSNIGLVEINAVRATRDQRETGRINPNVRAQVAVNPDSELIPVTRSNGVLLAVSAPSGGLISGRSAVLQLDGWTWEDMTVKSDIGMHIEWPHMSPVSAWWQHESAKEQMEERDEALQEIDRAFADARAWWKAHRAGAAAVDSRWTTMVPVFERKVPLIVRADDVKQIQAAVAFADRQNVRLVIYGGYDAMHCVDLLKEHDVPVILAGVYRLPQRRGDDYDAPFTLPARLHKAGVTYCISGAGRFGASNARNLPYHAATAIAYGLSEDEALKSITLYPAEILGVSDRVGSLEQGKDATLFIADGDPLEAPTRIESAYIQGRLVDLSDRHKRLWRKYQEKYRRMAD